MPNLAESQDVFQHLGGSNRRSDQLFTYVAAEQGAEWLSFNSTLVRLRREDGKAVVADSTSFQFHIGSIKTVTSVEDIEAQEIVSIPHWFD